MPWSVPFQALLTCSGKNCKYHACTMHLTYKRWILNHELNLHIKGKSTHTAPSHRTCTESCRKICMTSQLPWRHFSLLRVKPLFGRCVNDKTLTVEQKLKDTAGCFRIKSIGSNKLCRASTKSLNWMRSWVETETEKTCSTASWTCSKRCCKSSKNRCMHTGAYTRLCTNTLVGTQTTRKCPKQHSASWTMCFNCLSFALSKTGLTRTIWSRRRSLTTSSLPRWRRTST